jgi:hypothetical protein
MVIQGAWETHVDVQIARATPDDPTDVLSLLSQASLSTDRMAEHFGHYLVARTDGRLPLLL